MSMDLTIMTPTALSERRRRCRAVEQEEEKNINNLIKELKRREMSSHLRLPVGILSRYSRRPVSGSNCCWCFSQNFFGKKSVFKTI